MMRWVPIVRRHRFADLVAHAFFEAIDRLDLVWSTAIFKVKCRLLGIGLGGNCRVWGRVLIRRFPGSTISIGAGLRAVSRPRRYAFNIFPQSKIRTYSPAARIAIADRVGFNSISILARSQAITIGEGTLIGGNCQIMDTNGHPLWPPDARAHYPGSEHDAPVTIGANVFIGLNVIVTKGAVIGENSVIGAGSVVVGEIPPNCLAAGVPARVVKRFDSVAMHA